MRLVALSALVAAVVAAAASAAPRFALRSPAFPAHAPIPIQFTCDGQNVSPPLAWTAPPAGARSLALLVDDPDAPGRRFTHWTVWGIRPTVRKLAQGTKLHTQGRNGVRRVGWFGPCPPEGPDHRYVFRLYALKSPLPLRAGAERAAFDRALRGRVLRSVELIGHFGRRTRP